MKKLSWHISCKIMSRFMILQKSGSSLKRPPLLKSKVEAEAFVTLCLAILTLAMIILTSMFLKPIWSRSRSFKLDKSLIELTPFLSRTLMDFASTPPAYNRCFAEATPDDAARNVSPRFYCFCMLSI